jgi:hypothetical protein
LGVTGRGEEDGPVEGGEGADGAGTVAEGSAGLVVFATSSEGIAGATVDCGGTDELTELGPGSAVAVANEGWDLGTVEVAPDTLEGGAGGRGGAGAGAGDGRGARAGAGGCVGAGGGGAWEGLS